MRKEFTIENVVKVIEEVSPPTPTDESHDAVWWNSNFGKSIRTAFKEATDGMIEKIEKMAEY